MIDISDITFIESSSADARRGLLGWAGCTLNDALRLDGLGVRRTRAGDIRLSFPGRRDRAGQMHYAVRPLDTATRVLIEEQVLRALNLNRRRLS